MRILVTPKAGKALFVNDPETFKKDKKTGKVKWFNVSWTEQEAKDKVGKKVPQTKVFLSHLKNGTLEQV